MIALNAEGISDGEYYDPKFGRWLEDPAAADTLEWVEAQNAITEEYLASIPVRASLRERMTELWNYPRYSVPSHEGKY